MPSFVEEIEEKIRSLKAEEKIRLLRALIAELDGPTDGDVERAWVEEAKRRYQELTDGKVEPVPAERVFENLRSRLQQ